MKIIDLSRPGDVRLIRVERINAGGGRRGNRPEWALRVDNVYVAFATGGDPARDRLVAQGRGMA